MERFYIIHQEATCQTFGTPAATSRVSLPIKNIGGGCSFSILCPSLPLNLQSTLMELSHCTEAGDLLLQNRSGVGSQSQRSCQAAMHIYQ